MNDSNQTQRFDRISAPVPATPKHAAPAHAAKGGSSPQKKRSGGKRAGMAAGIVVGVALALYAGGFLLFSNVYYPNTSIAGVDVSLMSERAAVGRVESSAQNYALTIEGNDFSFKFSPADGQLPVNVQDRAEAIMDANEPLAWPARLLEALAGTQDTSEAQPVDGRELPELSRSFDSEGFTSELSAAIDAYNEGRSGVFDAPSAYDEKAGAFTLERAKTNVKINKDQVIDEALLALSDLVSEVELDESDFEQLAGNATDSELEAACEAANELIGVDVNLKMAGQTVATLDGKQLATWITFDEALAPSLDRDALTTWAQELDDGLDTVGTERTYTRPDGKVVTVGGGTYGWIVDSAALVDAINEAFANKQTGDLDVPLKSEGAVFTKLGEKDWAEYIDVDLTEQHARYYDASGNLVWESGCITGNPNLGNATPTGIYRMNNCMKNVTLVGEKDPETGEPEYKTPVAYWMPFVGGAVGLHDASWQASSNFSNPNAFYSVGSHGCVNLPPDKAGELYNLVKSGICVIVHN